MVPVALMLYSGQALWASGSAATPASEEQLPPLPDAPGKPIPATPPTSSPAVPGVEAAMLLPIKLDVPPYTDKGISMVPMRPLFSFLGASVSYKEGTITIVKRFENPPDTRVIVLRVGGSMGRIQESSGERLIHLAAPAEERLGTVFVPLRFVAEALDAKVEHEAERGTTTLRTPNRAGFIAPTAQEGYHGPDATRVTILNRVGKALSLRLTGPRNMAIELGTGQSLTRSMRPGVYYYRAASTGMRPRIGVRRLLAGRKATWAWGRK